MAGRRRARPPSTKRIDLSLRVALGRADMPSLHATTMALVEALLVGVATARPAETLASLERPDALRVRPAGTGTAPPRDNDAGPRRGDQRDARG